MWDSRENCCFYPWKLWTRDWQWPAQVISSMGGNWPQIICIQASDGEEDDSCYSLYLKKLTPQLALKVAHYIVRVK